jgi:LPXTG-motif cell wall-anchored protein
MIPDGQKFTVDGQEVDAFGLKKGMKVTATKIVETAVTAVTEHTQVTGTIPAGGTVLIAKGAPTPAAGGAGSATAGTTAEETTTAASAKLPKTGTGLPLLGVLGLLLIATSLGMALLRRSFGLRG